MNKDIMENNEVVEKEVIEVPVAAEAEAAVEEATVVEAAETKVETPKEDMKVRNLRRLAQSRDKLKNENATLLAEKLELEKKLAGTKVEEEDEDDIYRGKLEDMEKRQVVQQKKYDAQAKVINNMILEKAEKRILEKYIDFADVVSTQNVSQLEGIDAEAVKEIIAEKDVYKMGIKAYEAIRRNGIYDKALVVASNKEAVLSNIDKPKSAVSAPRKSPEGSSVFADLHSRDYQNKLRLQLAQAKQRV